MPDRASTGQGQMTFRLEPEVPKTEHRLTVYQHFVSTPVPIGAATSPTAMLRSARNNSGSSVELKLKG